MELIVIDDRKLKIMLTPPDMRHYDLHAERMTTTNAATRRAFRHIFDDARERIGFDTAGERLLVQLYTSRGGGCEIFVTKLGLDEESIAPDLAALDGVPLDLAAEDALLARITKEEPMTTLSPTAHRSTAVHPVAEVETTAYRTSVAEDLFALCRRLRTSGFAGESAVYISEDDLWYLFLTPSGGVLPPVFVREYVTELPYADDLPMYLSEHGRIICPTGAVEALGNA